MVDADRLAHEVLEPDGEAFEDAVRIFGRGILDRNGEIDRERLGQAVFHDETLRRRLESVTHPRIAMRARKAFELIEGRGAPIAVYEAALLIEAGLHTSLDATIVVTVPAALQLQRLMERDGMNEEAARARLKAQLPLEAKAKEADFLIDNAGDLASTRAQVQSVWTRLLARFGARN